MGAAGGASGCGVTGRNLAVVLGPCWASVMFAGPGALHVLAARGAALTGLVCRRERSCHLMEARHVLVLAGSLSQWLNVEVGQTPRCRGHHWSSQAHLRLPQGCRPHLCGVRVLLASVCPSVKGLKKGYWDWLPS